MFKNINQFPASNNPEIGYWPAKKVEREENLPRLIKAVTRKAENDPRINKSEVSYIIFNSKPEEVFDVTKGSEPTLATHDYKKIKQLKSEHNGEAFTSFHNHCYTSKQRLDGMGSIPSDQDFFEFIMDDDEKAMLVAQMDYKTGKIAGFYHVSKTESTVMTGISFSDKLSSCKTDEELEKASSKIMKGFHDANPDMEESIFDYRVDATWQYRLKAFGRLRTNMPPKDRQAAIDEVCKTLGLDIEYLPSGGYEYKEGTGFFD